MKTTIIEAKHGTRTLWLRECDLNERFRVGKYQRSYQESWAILREDKLKPTDTEIREAANSQLISPYIADSNLPDAYDGYIVCRE